MLHYSITDPCSLVSEEVHTLVKEMYLNISKPYFRTLPTLLSNILPWEGSPPLSTYRYLVVSRGGREIFISGTIHVPVSNPSPTTPTHCAITKGKKEEK